MFEAKLLVKGNTTAYFDLLGMWLALNEEKNIPRNEIHSSYTHIAFSIEEKEYSEIYNKLKELDVNILQVEKEIRVIRNLFILPIQMGISLSSIQEL